MRTARGQKENNAATGGYVMAAVFDGFNMPGYVWCVIDYVI